MLVTMYAPYSSRNQANLLKRGPNKSQPLTYLSVSIWLISKEHLGRYQQQAASSSSQRAQRGWL
jgi:hypothetical protein